ncbi:omega-hydroxypalmitate O-feruloyl transferase-like isoform X3 [Ipomoea triloba]|uniref:omega-hydroxypalmitate O-feruloyl transferase-like isoform X3 n=1 Tax=Ipomoea triloba TaxID=35885 RepID=UPI00125E761B|nr:omega-hydroxypalmitate O-feruloyl transferase-like isoform X3 [Ipomoea triloba]
MIVFFSAAIRVYFDPTRVWGCPWLASSTISSFPSSWSCASFQHRLNLLEFALQPIDLLFNVFFLPVEHKVVPPSPDPPYSYRKSCVLLLASLASRGTYQVTAFKCGGFALGTSRNHISFDGSGFKMFLENLAALAFNDDGPLAVVPCNDRSLLAARSPPQVTFPHPELLKVNLPAGEKMAPPVFSLKEDLSFEIFQLSSADIDGLKDKAKAPDNVKTKVTGFNALTAAIWRCKALSCGGDNNSDRLSTVLFAVDIRWRLNPPLPASYSGNAVLTGYATAKCAELEEGPFWKTVQMVYEGAARMTDEYARSAIDWGELYKGFPHGEFLVSSWWRLGFEGVQFPWGKPKYSCPVVHHRKDIILLFPDIDNGGNSNRGVNVLVALPPKEMEKFKSLFHTFLA